MQPDLQSSFKYVPGAELVSRGLADLAGQVISEAALVVMVASPRLRRLGIQVPAVSAPRPYEHALYTLVEERYGRGALSYYNSLLRRVVSFCRALEREASIESTAHGT